MNSLKYIIFGFFLILGCTNKDGESQIENTANSFGEPVTVILSQEQMSAIKLKLGHIQERNLTNVVKANGYLDVPPQNQAVISPMITGYVRKINFLLGDNVNKGQVMAELESMEFIDMQQQYIELCARLEFLKEDYERQKLLREQDAVSRKTFLMAEMEYKRTVSTLEGIKSKLNLLGTDIENLDQGKIESRITMKAPISGSVKSMNTVIGRHVDPSEEIFEIVNQDHLHLELNVYERDVQQIKKDQKVWFTVPSLGNTMYEGEVFLVGKNLTEDNRSINVHVHIHGDESQFTVGMYVNATIVIVENPSKTLPATALVVDGNNKYVFKKKEAGHGRFAFEKIPVFTGIESGALVELTNMNDLSLDDEIVVDGAFYLLNAFSQGE